MGFKEWVIDLLSGKAINSEGVEIDICENIEVKNAIKELAIDSAIKLIADAISLSEFKKFENGKEVKDDDYFAFNYEPNPNYSGHAFWKKLIYKLFINNEALIIKNGDAFYVADNFTKISKAFYPNYYKNITVENFKLERGYQESEVMYFKLNEESLKNIIDKIYREHGKLIEYSKSSYRKNNAKRGIMNIPASYPQTEDAKEKLIKLLNEDIRKFYKSENGAVLPLTNGITYTDLSADSYKNGTDSRDIRNLIDDVFDFVAMAFGIPPQLIKGSSADLENIMDRFIKFPIDPIAEMLQDEINRKMFLKSSILKNTYIKIDTSKVKASSLSKLATTIDILTRNGVHSIDENRELIGKEPLRTEESEKRHMTKNYD